MKNKMIQCFTNVLPWRIYLQVEKSATALLTPQNGVKKMDVNSCRLLAIKPKPMEDDPEIVTGTR